MLSTKDLVFKKQPARKLVDQYIGLYKIVSTNVVNIRSTVWSIYIVLARYQS